MADKKVTQLDALTSLSGDDLFMVVDDPAGTPVSKKITVTNAFTGMTAVITAGSVSGTFALKTNTPESSTQDGSFPAGSIFYDNDFIYVAISASTIRRAALSDF